MMLQLKKPLRLAPFVHWIHGFLRSFSEVKRSFHLHLRQRHALPAVSLPLNRAEVPPIEVTAVPLEETPITVSLPTSLSVPEPQPVIDRPVEGSVDRPPEGGTDRPAESGSAGRPAEGGNVERSRQVTQLLDEAWAQGRTSYPQLMDYVREKSGTGCSRRTIANWKRARQLSE